MVTSGHAVRTASSLVMSLCEVPADAATYGATSGEDITNSLHSSML